MRCPSFSVSTSTPSQSNRSAAGRGVPGEDDAEEQTTRPPRLSPPLLHPPGGEHGGAFLPSPAWIWRAEVEASPDETGRRRWAAVREAKILLCTGRAEGVATAAAAAAAAATAPAMAATREDDPHHTLSAPQLPQSFHLLSPFLEAQNRHQRLIPRWGPPSYLPPTAPPSKKAPPASSPLGPARNGGARYRVGPARAKSARF